MALEEELMKEELNTAKEAVEWKNFDDLTDDEIESVKELSQSAWWEVIKKCMEKRIEKQKEDIITLAKDNCFSPKPDGYTYYEILGAFIQWIGEVERFIKIITADPEEIKKAMEAIQKAEAIARGEKVEWVD
jgi:hypothetical protein